MGRPRTWISVWGAIVIGLLALRAVGAIRSVPLCAFLAAVAGALLYAGFLWRRLESPSPFTSARQLVLLLLLVAVPSLADPSTAEVDNIPRLVILSTAAVLVAGLWAADSLVGWRPRRLINGLQWPILTLVGWTAVTTVTSLLPRTSLVGAYQSSDGLVTIASLGVIALAMSESFRGDQLRSVLRCVVVGVIPVLVYGLIQVHDVYSATPWDFAAWKTGVTTNVFSTLGNPNHLGGLLATVLPLIVVYAAAFARRRSERALLWMAALVTLLLMLKTADRGAWLATLLGAPLLVAGLWPLVRRQARVVAAAVLGLLGLAVVGVSSSSFTGEPLSAVFAHSSASSIGQRYGYWMAAIRTGLHHPVAGVGPDVYSSVYTRYQDATLAKTLGTGTVVNGPHNVFLAWFADQGVAGLAAMVALFGAALWVAWRLWRLHRTDQTSTSPAYLAAGLGAATVAYGVQACFDVDQVATWFILWVVLGLLGSVARSTWPSFVLSWPRPARGAASETPAQVGDDAHLTEGFARWAGRAHPQVGGTRRAGSRSTLLALALVVAAAASGIAFWRTDALWRADHLLWAAFHAADGSDPTGDLIAATRTDPWEPTYYRELGAAAMATLRSGHAGSQGRRVLVIAEESFARALSLDPYDSSTQLDYAVARVTQAENHLGDLSAARKAALQAIARAKADDPFDTRGATVAKSVASLPG